MRKCNSTDCQKNKKVFDNQKFGAKPNVSPPGALSPIGENWGEVKRGERISPASKSRGPNLNASVYAERALST